ncbi:MAG: 2-oxoglutarate dehydrogenase complex dihydrolipoyllysine-residue succinyltransferase [Myxococcota bacterium]|nr:2-oxoglutarate dehydrogenase complex dihydrolipoyllysine-residue succinyltransferase [Myxococcota bacterium]
MSESVDIIIPTIGESIKVAYIAEVFKNVGDEVEQGDALFSVDSDKATLEVPAPCSGVVTALSIEEGDELDIGSKVGAIQKGASVAKSSAASTEAAPKAESVEVAKGQQTGPAARLEADRLNVDIGSVQGSGVRGRVLSKDVQAAVQPKQAKAPSQSTSNEERTERVRMTPLRRTIARRLVEAQQTAAMLTTFNEADLTNIKRIRASYQDRFVKKYDCKLGFMSFFMKATIEALREYPAVNAEIDGDHILYKRYYNIGVAVSSNKGLVVPVVRDAEQLSFAGIEQEISRLAGLARSGKLKLSDFQDGTFTISNGGVFGSLMSTPILNPPQVGILGMHTIQNRPVNVNGAVEIRPMMYLALSYDHRIIDGRQAVGFLKRIKELVEDPERILFEI